MHLFKKIKKKLFFLLLIFLIFLFFFFFYNSDYEKEYYVNDIKIVEKWNKNAQRYIFSFETKGKDFLVSLKHKYIHKKKLIGQIKIKEKGNGVCIFPESKEIEMFPLCKIDDEAISYHLIMDEELISSNYKSELSYEEKKYNNVMTYALKNNKYYLWNYKGFTVVSNNGTKEIKLFDEDVYNIPLVIKVEHFLLVANYDEKFNFHKFYVIDTKKDKVRELEFEKEISFDSLFLGVFNKKAYLLDKKNKIEYEINPKKMLIQKVSKDNEGKILKNDIFESIGMNALISGEKVFTHKELTKYLLDTNTLYQVQENYKTKITDKIVRDIIFYKENTVYYLVNETLYSYNNKEGEVPILSHFEWNFNYKNMIFIF